MLTNEFGNPFLTRSLLQFRGKMATPLLSLQNEIDGFALGFQTGKSHLSPLAPLTQPAPQLHPYQQLHLPPQYPSHNSYPLQFLHPSRYSLHPSHYPRMYAGAAAAAAAAAAAIEHSIPFSHHVMTVTPSLAKVFLPQALSMKNPDMVGIGTLGIGFPGESNNNKNNNNENSSCNSITNNDIGNKRINDSNQIGYQSSNSPTVEQSYTSRIENKISTLNDKDTTRNIIGQSLRTGEVGGFQVQNSTASSVNNLRLLGNVRPTHDPHRNLMFYQGREKSDKGRKIFLCPQCHYVTDRKNNLKRHIITMHQDCPKILECCGVMFRSKAMLREHVSLFHSSGYRCRVCGRNFCRKALLRRHLSVHNGQKDFICPLCSYATSHKSNLERHQKVHNKKSSSLGAIGGVGSSRLKGFNEDLSKISVESAEDQKIPFDHDPAATSQMCTQTADPYLYRSPPIESAIEIPRTKKFLLPDRLNQTYTEKRAQSIGPDPIDSGTDIALQIINDQKESVSNANYQYRHIYANSSSDSSNNGDNYHLYTHHHHHHHHHHHINTTVASMQMADNTTNKNNNNQAQSSGKIIKRKPPRIFMASYKCIDCRKVFSHQSLLNSHSCLTDQPKSQDYLSIVRPIANKQQPAKQIVNLTNKRAASSAAVVVVSTSVNNWCESLNPYSTSPSILSKSQGLKGNTMPELEDEEMVVLSPEATCYSSYAPALFTAKLNRKLKSKSDQQTFKNTSASISRNVPNDSLFEDASNNNLDDITGVKTKIESYQNDKRPKIVEEKSRLDLRFAQEEYFEQSSTESVDESRRTDLNECSEPLEQQQVGGHIGCKINNKKTSKEILPEELKDERNAGTNEDSLNQVELSDNVKIEVDPSDDGIENADDSFDNEMEDDKMPLPLKKRPIKEDGTTEEEEEEEEEEEDEEMGNNLDM